MKPCIIFNPAARGEKAARFRKLLTTLSSQCALKPTRAPGDAQTLAAESVREGFNPIIAAGGDGTVNEVLNGIASVSDGFDRVRLAVLPLGTINVFAKELGLPSSLKAAWKVVQAGRERVIDVARADFCDSAGHRQRYFVQMAGAGWDARAVELVSLDLKRRIGGLAYVAAGLKALGERLPRILVECGSARAEGDFVLLGNGAFYGGRWRLFPEASLCDGLLEVSVFPRLSWFGMMRGTAGLLGGELYRLGGVQHLRGPMVRLSSVERAPFHVEGEYAGCLPVEFSVEDRRLRVAIP
jgi:YegS/Rv2252/BmrU family lipid kinase